MARRRRRTRRRNPVANPPRRRRYYGRRARRTARRAGRRLLGGLSFRTALKNTLLLNVGMFSAKAATRMLGGAASETDPTSWTWSSYIRSGLGGAGAAMLVNAVRPGQGQKVLEGALAFTLYKIIQNELVAGNETASKWFGADDDLEAGPLEGYYGYGAEELLDLDGDDDEVVMLDGFGRPMPINDKYRMRLGPGRRPPFRPGMRPPMRRRPPSPYGMRRFGPRPSPYGRRPPIRGRRPGYGPRPPFGPPPMGRRRFYGDEEEEMGSVLLPVGPMGEEEYDLADAMAPPGPLGFGAEPDEERNDRDGMLAAYQAAWQK